MKRQKKYGFTEIDDYETYYKTKTILNKIIIYIKQINGDELVDVGKLNITEDEYQQMMKNRKSDIAILLEEVNSEYEHLKELNK